MIENHECDLKAEEDGFEKLKGKSAEPISVGNHNLGEMTSQCEVQKGLKTFSFPIDARSDVCNHEVMRESRLEKIYLSVKVVHLFRGRDTTITCFLCRSMERHATRKVLNRREIVAALSGWSSNKVDLTLRSPETKSFGGNME